MDIPPIAPEVAGLSSRRLIRARDYAQRVGDSLGSPGGAALVIRRGGIVGEWYWGTRGRGDDRPFDANTMVSLASVTKGVTATALALCVQDGLLWLDEPAHLHIPELDQGEKASITIRNLATHSSGFPAGDPYFHGAWAEHREGEHPFEPFVRHALALPLAYTPGTAHIYSDPAVCLLGEIIYRVSGQRIPDLIRERVFEPLGLRRIGWDFDDEREDDIAPRFDVDGSRSRATTKEGRAAGSVWGGLIACARDLATFGLCLLREGELGGRRVIAPLAVRMMTSCQMPMPARLQYPHRGLLWWIKATPETPELGHLVPIGTYCHGGAAHSVLVVMPSLDIVAVMLRNVGGNPPGFLYNRDYPVFMDLVAAAVDEV